jgi:hypothetical protein
MPSNIRVFVRWYYEKSNYTWNIFVTYICLNI